MSEGRVHASRRREATRPAVVVHVTETFTGGVAAAITDYVRSSPELEHRLIYIERIGSRVDTERTDVFSRTTRIAGAPWQRAKSMRQQLNGIEGPIVIHAHSSYGGLYARISALKSRTRRIVYTPHCFAFERRDVTFVQRMAFRLVEWVLSFNTTTIAGCSPREVRLGAHRWVQTIYVPNIGRSVNASQREPTGRALRVAAVGRLSEQKDPLFMLAVKQATTAAGIEAEFIWLGDGEPRFSEALRNGAVEVSGWIDHREVVRRLADVDIYIHTALWEGFPISLLEAARSGAVIVSRSAKWTEGINLPVLIESPLEFVQAWPALSDAEGRTQLRSKTNKALAINARPSQREGLLRAYGIRTVLFRKDGDN